MGQVRTLNVPPMGTCEGSRIQDSGNLFHEGFAPKIE